MKFIAPFIGANKPAPEIARLSGRSGVYVIRSRTTKKILYVGESHTGRLRKTLIRHFQNWKGKTAGNTYDRNAIEIAVIPCADSIAVSNQDKLICKLNPRDNEIRTICPFKSPPAAAKPPAPDIIDRAAAWLKKDFGEEDPF